MLFQLTYQNMIILNKFSIESTFTLTMYIYKYNKQNLHYMVKTYKRLEA